MFSFFHYIDLQNRACFAILMRVVFSEYFWGAKSKNDISFAHTGLCFSEILFSLSWGKDLESEILLV